MGRRLGGIKQFVGLRRAARAGETLVDQRWVQRLVALDQQCLKARQRIKRPAQHELRSRYLESGAPKKRVLSVAGNRFDEQHDLAVQNLIARKSARRDPRSESVQGQQVWPGILVACVQANQSDASSVRRKIVFEV